MKQESLFDLLFKDNEVREEEQSRDDYVQQVEKMQQYSRAYYEEDAPVISDAEYDEFMKALKDMEKKHPDWIVPDSPTQKVGGGIKRDAVSVTHNVPMLSIDDLFSYEEVAEWVQSVKALHPDAEFSVEEKIDGLSCTLRYRREGERLVLYMAETRGTGYVGEDVTLGAMEIKGIQKELMLPYDYLELRGEVYMSKDDFEELNRKQEEAGGKLFANCRNAAAGTFRALNPSVVRERGLQMFCFNIQDAEPSAGSSHIAGMDMVSDAGVPVTFHRKCETLDEIYSAIEEIGERRETLAYDIDGAVIKINQIPYRADFPASGKNTDGMKAYKYPAEKKEVTLLDIELSVGRTGRIAPTGVVTPVSLCGTTVSRVTLHNPDYIRQMHAGIGGKYLIYKSGEIIPKLDRCTVEPAAFYEFPSVCPVCGHMLHKEEDTADYFCINPSCRAQLVRTVSYFCSRNAMDIKALGESYIEKLVACGYIQNYGDVYSLYEHREELISGGVIGKEKNTDRILAAIEESKRRGPVALLTALGIRNVGLSTSKALISVFGSIYGVAEASLDELLCVPDIGEVTAKCIKDFFCDAQNVSILKKLSEAGLVMDKQIVQEGKLSGKKFCITGTLSRGRKEVEAFIEENGGIASGYSKSIDYLIAGENAGSKLEKAKKDNIPVITEFELYRMAEE